MPMPPCREGAGLAMSDHAISIRGLGKKYTIRHEQARERYVALRDVLADRARRGLRRLAGRARKPGRAREEFWALRDVSFDIPRGQAVGIIGRNGAGKSTLLKLLSRITEPTEGRIDLRGRVASLLEVGTGFHPELTGRENIYLNGAILGMSRQEIRGRFDEIVEFSGVERFLDTPVKRFSSGMYVRLAFAVAAHLEPEILVVDEVLAVGDAGFQRKCLGKMGEVSRSEGRTILFVSHQLDMVRSLCSRCIMLGDGRMVAEGTPEEVIDKYLASTIGDGSAASFESPIDPSLAAQLIRGRVIDGTGAPRNRFDMYDTVAFELEYEIRQPAHGMVVTVQVKRHDQPLLMTFDTDENEALLNNRVAGRYRTVVRLPAPLLKPGQYSTMVNVGIANTSVLHMLTDVLHFEVDLLSRPSTFLSGAAKRPGHIATGLRWETERVG